MDDASPFHSRPAEVDHQCEMQARCIQVVDALSQMVVRELLNAFHFHQQAIPQNAGALSGVGNHNKTIEGETIMSMRIIYRRKK